MSLTWKILSLLLLAFAQACSAMPASLVGDKEPEPGQPTQVAHLQALYAEKLARANELRDPANGWLVTDGDGALWTSLYAASPGVTGVNLAAAESQTEPGKFCRYPGAECWALAHDPTTWSGDGGRGLLFAAWRTKDVALLERHVAYGGDHQKLGNGIPVWQMGEPLDDGRVLYKPGLIGEFFQALHALGASDSQLRLWPNAYDSGLVDFEAHLQVLGILLRGEVDGVGPFGLTGGADLRDVGDYVASDLAPSGDISRKMFERLKEHAAREPQMPLYAFALGRYTGNQERALDLCVRGSVPQGSFVRCHDFERCELAAWLFACGSLLQDLGKAAPS